MVFYLITIYVIITTNTDIVESDIFYSESDESTKPGASGGYGAVPFSYGNTEDPNDQKNADSGLECLGFQPPFPVPDSLIHNIVSLAS